jgi:hypothetical protein
LGKFFIVYANCLTKNVAFALALLFEGKIGSSGIFFAFLRKFSAIAKIHKKPFEIQLKIGSGTDLWGKLRRAPWGT